jgi:hypothetical protein
MTSTLTPKEVNDMKREHNEAQDHGRRVYKKLVKLYLKCLELQDKIREAEGDEYDAIPLLFGAGFHLDPDL